MNPILGAMLILIGFVVIVRQLERGNTSFTRVLALGVGLFLGSLLIQADSFSFSLIFIAGMMGLLLLYGLGGNRLLDWLGTSMVSWSIQLLARLGIEMAIRSTQQLSQKEKIDQMGYFVPQFIYEQYDAKITKGSFTAAAFVAGIPGFEDIPGLYSDPEGEDGPRLLAIAEQLFTPVIAAVYSHGGFIANFFGGFLAIFPGETPLPAVEVAKIAREQLHRPLFGIRLGIAMGPISWNILSAPAPPWVVSRQPSQNCYSFAGVVGEALSAAGVGKAGDIALTQTAVNMLPETVQTAIIGENIYRLTTLPTIEEGAAPLQAPPQIPLPHEADYYRVLALLHEHLGLRKQAIQQYEQAARAARIAQNPHTEAMALIEQSYLHLDPEDLIRYAELQTEATVIRQQADDPNAGQRQPLIYGDPQTGLVHTLTPAGHQQSWTLPESQLIETGHGEQLDCQAISGDGQLLVSSQNKRITCWRVSETTPFSEFAVPYQPQQIFIHPQNHQIATINRFEINETIGQAESYPFIQVWDCQTGQLIHTIEIWRPALSCVTDIAFVDLQWQSVAVGVRYLAPYEWDRTRLYVCPLDKNYSLKHKGMHRYQGETVTAMAFSKSCHLLAIGISDSGRYNKEAGFRVHLWSEPAKPSRKGTFYKQEHWLDGHQERINWLLFNETQQTLLSGSADHTIKIWAVSPKRLLRTLDEHEGAVLCGLLHPDGTRLATGDDKGAIIVWQLAEGVVIHKVQAYETAVSALTLASDGNTILSISIDGTPKQIDWRHS